jgi:acetyl-CoA C-acetyltransferase
LVYVLGGWQSDFSRIWSRENRDIGGAFGEAVREGLNAAALDADEVETGHVGNFTAELFAQQGLLGGFFGLVGAARGGVRVGQCRGAGGDGGDRGGALRPRLCRWHRADAERAGQNRGGASGRRGVDWP